MRTTVTLDNDLVAKAKDFSGIHETSALMQYALNALVERDAARRLAALGGSCPDLEPAARRRSEPKPYSNQHAS